LIKKSISKRAIPPGHVMNDETTRNLLRPWPFNLGMADEIPGASVANTGINVWVAELVGASVSGKNAGVVVPGRAWIGAIVTGASLSGSDDTGAVVYGASVAAVKGAFCAFTGEGVGLVKIFTNGVPGRVGNDEVVGAEVAAYVRVGDDVLSTAWVGASVGWVVGAAVGLWVGCEEGDAVEKRSKLGSMHTLEETGKAQVHWIGHQPGVAGSKFTMPSSLLDASAVKAASAGRLPRIDAAYV
jgi:hypothetical protein